MKHAMKFLCHPAMQQTCVGVDFGIQPKGPFDEDRIQYDTDTREP